MSCFKIWRAMGPGLAAGCGEDDFNFGVGSPVAVDFSTSPVCGLLCTSDEGIEK
jgi:hypothetical protein